MRRVLATSTVALVVLGALTAGAQTTPTEPSDDGRVEVIKVQGNVWLLARLFDLKDLRHSVGAGLRYVFPFGPIRVEYAWILGRKEGEPKGRFVFGLGHAF